MPSEDVPVVDGVKSSGSGFRRMLEAIPPEPAAARLADALRGLLDAATDVAIDDAAAAELAPAIDALAARLAARPRALGEGSLYRFHHRNPIAGALNPMAPPVDFEIVAGEAGPEVRFRLTLSARFEGPAGRAHGGVVAGLFDNALGFANASVGAGGYTGTLTIRFHKGTPLETELRMEARCTGTERRKAFAWAGLFEGDTLLAEAEAIFIRMPSPAEG